MFVNSVESPIHGRSSFPLSVIMICQLAEKKVTLYDIINRVSNDDIVFTLRIAIPELRVEDGEQMPGYVDLWTWTCDVNLANFPPLRTCD